MAALDVEITSNALMLVGDEPISSWSESDGGTVSEAFYETTKNTLLATYPWSFAIKDSNLALQSEEPDPLWDFKYSHKLPQDMLRLWRIAPDLTNYDISGLLLYSNTQDLMAIYTYSCDESLFPATFRVALEYRLASKFAMSITENATVMREMQAEYVTALRLAKHIDATQKPQMSMASAPFNEVRGGDSAEFNRVF
jgi:hypothetical protein